MRGTEDELHSEGIEGREGVDGGIELRSGVTVTVRRESSSEGVEKEEDEGKVKV